MTSGSTSGLSATATRIAGAAPRAGPTMGTIATSPARSASSSAAGSPSREYATLVITASAPMSVSWPRTQLPSRSSTAFQP